MSGFLLLFSVKIPPFDYLETLELWDNLSASIPNLLALSRVFNLSTVSFVTWAPDSSLIVSRVDAAAFGLLSKIFSAFYLISGSILISLYPDIPENTLWASALLFPLLGTVPKIFVFSFLWGIYSIQKPWFYLTGVPSAFKSLLTLIRAMASLYFT